MQRRWLRIAKPILPKLRALTGQRIGKRNASNVSLIKQSYVHGCSPVPLINMTVGQVLEAATEQNPQRDAFVFKAQSIRKTYEQFFEDTQRVASGLIAVGLKPGDRIGIWAPNYYEWVLTQFAAAAAGLVLVNINPAYQSGELEYCLRKVGVRAIVTPPSFKTQDYYGMLFELCPELVKSKPYQLHSSRLPELQYVFLIGEEKQEGAAFFNDLLNAGDSSSDAQVAELRKRIQTDSPCNIQFTSGTTGAAKGATLSHHNIVNNALFVGRRCNYHSHKTVICSPPPLYHCFGCVIGTLCAVVHCATHVQPALIFDSLAALKAVNDEKCTSLYGTPTMFIDMLNNKNFAQYDYSTLRTGIMAGAPCPVEVCRQCVEKLGMKEFTILYGTTENSPATFQTWFDDNEDRRTNSIGRVHDHVEAKVVDEHGEVVPIGQSGELLTRGYCVMLSYWDDEEKTAQVISNDRWYHTGDAAVFDEHGYCRIIGRFKDLIIRGGENVYPVEIEQVLYTHNKIEDVHVIGVPDARLGEEICAWIRLREGQVATEEEIRSFCKEKLAHFKIPKYILFKEESEFPLTVTGKVQKYKMRETSKKDLKLEHVISHI